jgi:uncharacterized membrane protein YfcA
MLVVAAVLALAIGLSLGLLGGGGSILTLPVLVYVLDVPPDQAIATSLLVVGTTALVSGAVHAHAGNVDYRTGAIFGAAGMGGAFGGGRLAGHVPGNVLLGAFAVVTLAAGIAMMRPRRQPRAGERPRISLPRIVAAGAGTGLIAGLVGAGGGFLIVPALVLFGGVDVRRAIGTSLLVIALQSFGGFVGHVGHTDIDLGLAGLVTGVAVIGSLAGARLAGRVRAETLRCGFAWLVLAMAVLMIWQQVSWIAAVAAAAVAALALFLVASRRHPADAPPAGRLCLGSKAR